MWRVARRPLLVVGLVGLVGRRRTALDDERREHKLEPQLPQGRSREPCPRPSALPRPRERLAAARPSSPGTDGGPSFPVGDEFEHRNRSAQLWQGNEPARDQDLQRVSSYSRPPFSARADPRPEWGSAGIRTSS